MRLKVLIASFLISMGMMAANSVTTVSSVSSSITVSSAVDYTITSATPFSGSGSVNITNTSKAVVILSAVKPSVVISSWLSYVKINGAAAVNGTNCQVKMYNKGTIILPYTESTISVLTCYTGTDYSGSSYSGYTTGSNGGYMKSLSSTELNNNIKSFKLKRGYMVTFATGPSGWGYSRCFVADKEDLEMNLPAVLAGKVSSYRLFNWQNFGKSGIANNTDATVCDALNVQGCYTYNVGENRLPDVEWLPHKIQKWWPGVAACGNTEYSCTMKTDNEPANSSDDNPATVAEVLGYWEDAMRTGMRLCSPSTYDGSNNKAWFDEFFAAIDARGWRCDIYDIHCYWTSFSALSTHYNYYNRPIIVSEWMYGASWNSNGSFASGVTDATIKSNVSSMLSTLNSTAYVERYFYWNSESKAKIYDGGITDLGQTYAATDGGLGYNKSYEYVPVVVIDAPYNVAATYSSGTNACSITWNDKNGDKIDSMVIERMIPGYYTYNRLGTVELQEYSGSAINYSYSDQLDLEGEYRYRIAVYPPGETTPIYSDVATVTTAGSAGYVDVTKDYVQNWGFDYSKDYKLVNVARGTYENVTGWTLVAGSEWGASACFPVGSSKTLNGGAIPATDLNGEVKGGMLAFSSGWSSETRYTQDVTLPAGSYKLSYCVYNSNNATSFTNLTGVTVGSTNYYGALTAIPGGEWRSETIDFSLSEETTVTLSVGYAGASTTTTNNALLRYDYVKLEQARTDYEDYSSYLTNPGFDITSDYQKSNLGTGSTNHKSVTAWTTTASNTWGCSACFQVGSGYTLNGQSAPSTGTGGLLGMSEGWSGECVYTQSVTLPAGTYGLKYAVYNVLESSNAFTNKTGVIIDGAAVYGSLTTLSKGVWATETVMFTLSEEKTITVSVGAKFAQASSTANPVLYFDYVSIGRLYDDFDQYADEEVLTPGDVVTDRFDTDAWSSATYSADGITGGEAFQWGASLDICSPMSQTVNLPNGFYTVEVYVMASSTSSRDNTSNVIEPDGATGYVTIHANDQSVDVPTYNRTTFDTFDTQTVLTAEVTNGTLSVSINVDQTGPNWLVLQIKKVTYLGKVLGDTNADEKFSISDMNTLIDILQEKKTSTFKGIGNMDRNNSLSISDIEKMASTLIEE